MNRPGPERTPLQAPQEQQQTIKPKLIPAAVQMGKIPVDARPEPGP